MSTLNIQPKQQADILLHGPNKAVPAHLHEGPGGEQAVGTRLVAGPNPLHLQLLGHLVEAPIKVVVQMDHAFDVVHDGEENMEEVQEFFPGLRQLPAS